MDFYFGTLLIVSLVMARVLQSIEIQPIQLASLLLRIGLCCIEILHIMRNSLEINFEYIRSKSFEK